jgi:F-type H+-transporting ATPase subunit epsilon
VTLRVELVIPEGELWAGQAEMVIAKTLEGDIGVLTGHAPVIGILAEGSLVRIRPQSDGEDVVAAVSGGFFSVADDRVSVLARHAELGTRVDTASAQTALDAALESGAADQGGDEPSDVRYYRALLRAAGDRN